MNPNFSVSVVGEKPFSWHKKESVQPFKGFLKGENWLFYRKLDWLAR